MSWILIASGVALSISLIGLAWTILLMRKTLKSRTEHTETEQRKTRRSAVLDDSVLEAARKAAEATREAAEELKELRESTNLKAASKTESTSHWAHALEAGKSIEKIRDRTTKSSYDDGHDLSTVGDWSRLPSGLTDLYRDDQTIAGGVLASVHLDHDLVTRPESSIARAVSVKKSSLASKHEVVFSKRSSILKEELLSDLMRKTASARLPFSSRTTVVSSDDAPASDLYPDYWRKYSVLYDLSSGSKSFVRLTPEDDPSLSQKEAPSADSTS